MTISANLSIFFEKALPNDTIEDARERLRQRLISDAVEQINKMVSEKKVVFRPADKKTVPESCGAIYADMWRFENEH